MRENVWRGMLAFPHVLPHAHMTYASSLTGCACICVGGHVEGTHSPFHKSSLIHTPSYQAWSQPPLIKVGWAIQYGTRVCVTFTVRSFLYRIILGMRAFWEGLMQPLDICSIGSQAHVSPTHFVHWRVPVPWFTLSHLCPHLIHSHIPPYRSQPFLHPCQILTSHQKWTGLVCVCTMVCFIPSLPAISFTHQFHLTGLRPVLCSHKVLTLHQYLTGWLCPHLHRHLVANPPSHSLHSALAHWL